MSPTKNWQRVEMRIARYFGATREKSKLSSDKKESCDFVTDGGGLAEVKLRKDWPSAGQIEKWWEKLCLRATKENRYPIFALQIGRQPGFWYAERELAFKHSTWKKEEKDGR